MPMHLWEKHSVTTLKGVGDKLEKMLARLGIETLGDLLLHVPIRYQNRHHIVPIMQAPLDRPGAVLGCVQHSEVVGQQKRMLIVTLMDSSGVFCLRFFRFFPQQASQFKYGQWVWCFGEVKENYHGRELVHPEYHLVNDEDTPTQTQTLTPIYPTTEGLRQVKLRSFIEDTLKRSQKEHLSDFIAPYLSDDWPSLQQALMVVHAPHHQLNPLPLEQRTDPNYRRLALEELVAHHLTVLNVRHQYQAQQGVALVQSAGYHQLASQLCASLPFDLTSAQQRVIQEISADLEQITPMMRLVQGDVGSGKTLVAAFSALQAISAQQQVALMAPTEILAEQHYANFCHWLEPLGLRVGILIAKQRDKQRQEQLTGIQSGQIHIVIGTHALFQKHVEFAHLALVIIDEQHRFGVHQRLSLRDKGHIAPHQLVMTATPIPRTLAMTVYADLSYSVIDELPKGRQLITTSVVSDGRRDEVIERVRYNCLEDKRQAYWVCPLIEESEQLACQAVQATQTYLMDACPELKIGLIHGRLKSPEKQAVMQNFQAGQLHVLVATTVIEVGVDVPNASLMIIENPERLGLAQLHQLRGRVGRGKIASHCVLLYKSPLTPEGHKRLAVLRETQDGFTIAEADLAIRGPGEWLGARQTGLVHLKIADLNRDRDLIDEAKKIATRIHAQNPQQANMLVARWIRVKEKDVAHV